MGIPKYFRHITSKFPSVIINTNTKVEINNLYFDMNCLIHPCVRNVSSKYNHLLIEYNREKSTEKYQSDPTYITNLEHKIYDEIGSYLDKLINIVGPSNMVYMAIDGVAPRAKMEQQRTRRYRAIKIKELENKVYNKYDITKHSFDTNCITPGTIFLYKLSQFLKRYIQNCETNITYILDDSGNKGEGEHKILQHIKNHTCSEINSIYGLDADLIMLSLCSESKIYLLREEVHFGKVDTDSFLYLDIEELGDNLYDDIYMQIRDKLDESIDIEITRQSIINDYICLCFFIGNDFLPHLNGIDILTNSINDLLRVYIDIYLVRHKPLVIDGNINFIFVRQIITNMFSNEHKYLNKYQKCIDRFHPRMEYTNDMELELEKIRFYPLYHKEKVFNFGEDNWIDKYYKYYFNIDNILIQKDNIDEICENYIVGLQWNIKYYLDKCPSYTWYYRYRAAPNLRELSKYLIQRVYPAKLDCKISFTPLEQLGIVLPIQSSELWCNSYRSTVKTDLTLTSFYPTDFKLDTLHNNFLYLCEPILMDIDHNYIKKIFNDIKLTSFEKLRNSVSGLYCKSNTENISLSIT